QKLEEDNARLVREVQAARVRPPLLSGPPPLRTDGVPAAVRALAPMGERLTRKEKDLVALRGELEVAVHEAAAKEQALTAERARNLASDADRRRGAEARIALAALEKASVALRADRVLALQRGEEARRLTA